MVSVPSAEMLKVILEEVQQTRRELREHIAEERIEFDRIKEKLYEHDTNVALTKQKVTLISAAIALAVSGLFTMVFDFFQNHSK